MAGKWRNIGLALRLDDSQLGIIQDNNSDVTTRLTDMLRQWLNKTYDVERFGQPSWQMLSEAVRSPAGGNNPALAAQIEEKHGGIGRPGYSSALIVCLHCDCMSSAGQ